jgi:Immunoglobulin domain/Regulator of chromosome condensation (RCC1) repeat
MWYLDASDTYSGTHYKQSGDWINKSVSWRCQLQFNYANYGSAQTAVCSAGSASVIFSVSAPSSPSILVQPAAQSAEVGGAVTFSVSASGEAPISYQWRKNGINISGATGSTYTISSVTSNHAGEYTCYVSNYGGGVTSTAATLSVVSGGGGVPPSSGSGVAVPSRPSSFPLLRPSKKGRVIFWGNSAEGPPSDLGLLVQVSAGNFHCLGLRPDGTVVGWGSNIFGQTTIPAGLSNVVKVVAAGFFSIALKADGTVAAWGRDEYRYTGPWWHGGPNVPTLTGVVDIRSHPSSGAAVYALKLDGTVSLSGIAFTEEGAFPSGLTNVVQLGSGDRNCMALRGDGSALGWGSKRTPDQVTIPSGLGALAQVEGCSIWSVALKTNGTVVTWGDSYYQTPTGLSDVVQIAAGSSHMLALNRNGTVVAWGNNTKGESTVPATLTNVIQVSAGPSKSLALVEAIDPKLSVQRIGGATVSSNGSWDFGGILIGETTPKVFFQLKNDGTEPLKIASLEKNGSDASDFIVGQLGASTLNSGESTDLSLSFLPSKGGLRSCEISIASNDPQALVFKINISGHGLAEDVCTSGDGMNDAAKYRLRALGFDWQQAQPELVAALLQNAEAAGLYSSNSVVTNAGAFGLFTAEQYDANRVSGRLDVISSPLAYSLYTSASIMELHMGGMMVQKQGGNAVVSFQPQTTTDLTQPFTNNGTPITNTIPMPGNKGFLRIQAR